VEPRSGRRKRAVPNFQYADWRYTGGRRKLWILRLQGFTSDRH